MSNYHRFHLTLHRSGKEPMRTTLSMDSLLADLLAVSLGETPRTRSAHTAAREWLDKSLSEWPAFDPDLPISRQAMTLAIQRVADPRLLKALEGNEINK